jgi:hypothetical protein
MTGLPTCHLYSLLNSLDNAVHVSHLHISEVCPDRIFKTDLISENKCSIKGEKLGKVIKKTQVEVETYNPEYAPQRVRYLFHRYRGVLPN